MRFRDGTLWQQALFAALVGVYVLGLAIALQDKLARVGRPDIGWAMDGPNVSPTRWDAAVAGLWGGGWALRINGIDLEGKSLRSDVFPRIRRAVGDTNSLTLQRPGGPVADVTVRVRPWEWEDVLFAEGTTIGLAALFVVVGVTSFLLRPFAASSWALLTLCTAAGGLLTTRFLPDPMTATQALYFRTMVGVVAVVPFHAGLAFPVVHPLLVRRPRILLLIYALGLSVTATQFMGWYTEWAGPLRHAGGGLDTSVLLAAMLFFVARCSVLAVRARDPLIGQRARILVAGTLAGVVPMALVNFVRNAFGILLVDMRLAYLTLTLFLLALGYITVRQDLLNARIAVRRAVIYAAVAGILTLLATLLVAVRSYAVVLLLLPLLYWWSRFDARLNAWLYPQRARFSELLRAIGTDLATCATVDEVLDVLAQAPGRLCDARGGVAFLFAGVSGSAEHVSGSARRAAARGRVLADEPLVQLMRTTRKEIFRDHIAIEPQYTHIREACYACFDRLGADVLLPILQDGQVVGGLAVGPRATRDVYQAPELAALSAAAQQAVQSIIRIEATDRLRARELEFADLKRFFPPLIIDQVMAKGGAAELRSQRKLVTVVFADLRGFTSFSDSVEPEEVMATLAEYHDAMGRRIAEFSGTLERFVGDGFMVFFNDPVDQPDHVQRSARMVLAMRADIQRLRQEWMRKGYQIDVGMGIHTGYATCGFIGYEGRRDYGVIGNVTNLAARLSDAAGGGEILITARVRAELTDGYQAESVGELTLKGFHQPQAAYRLL
jgi:class 3 adenylate cyclase